MVCGDLRCIPEGYCLVHIFLYVYLQGSEDVENADDLPPPPEYWMVQSRVRSPGDEPPPPAPPPGKHSSQSPPHSAEDHPQHHLVSYKALKDLRGYMEILL